MEEATRTILDKLLAAAARDPLRLPDLQVMGFSFRRLYANSAGSLEGMGRAV
jgi:hypothetical protein